MLMMPGRRITARKFCQVRVIPIPNMTSESSGMIAGFHSINRRGFCQARIDPVMASSGNSSVNFSVKPVFM